VEGKKGSSSCKVLLVAIPSTLSGISTMEQKQEEDNYEFDY
jgi:hypothetical protein